MQLKTNKDGLVMRRRTVTSGGRLGGVAHRIPDKYQHGEHGEHAHPQGHHNQQYPNQHGAHQSVRQYGNPKYGLKPYHFKDTVAGSVGTYGNPNTKYRGAGAEHL